MRPIINNNNLIGMVLGEFDFIHALHITSIEYDAKASSLSITWRDLDSLTGTFNTIEDIPLKSIQVPTSAQEWEHLQKLFAENIPWAQISGPQVSACIIRHP